jgi:hypothetical protein
VWVGEGRGEGFEGTGNLATRISKGGEQEAGLGLGLGQVVVVKLLLLFAAVRLLLLRTSVSPPHSAVL